MEPGNPNSNDDYILEHYRALREQYITQGNRLWNRFNFFLTGGLAPGVGPREVSDISWKTIKLSLENGAILTFLRAKRAFF